MTDRRRELTVRSLRVIRYDTHAPSAPTGPGAKPIINPYDPPQVPSASLIDASSLLDEQSLAALEPLQKAILTLRIIVLALASGVVMFAVITLLQRRVDQPWAIGANLDTFGVIMLALAAMSLAMGIVLPAILFRTIQVPPQLNTQHTSQEPGVHRVMQVQARIQVATIIGAALFEGGAFGNLVAFMLSGEVLNLVAGAVLLAAILSHFPWPGRCEQRIAREFRRQAEEQAFRREP